MKNTFHAFLVSLALMLCSYHEANSQVIDPAKSANAAAVNDMHIISDNIQDNEDDLALARKALERATDPRIKEMAQQFAEDHTTLLYSFQELNSAGANNAEQSAYRATNNAHISAAEFGSRLSGVSGYEFDTMWVANLFVRRQAKLDELTQLKPNVRNPQLQRAIGDAIPIMRKQRSTLNVLNKEFAKVKAHPKKQ